MAKPDFRPAGRFWGWVLGKFSAEAVYLPWRVVYHEGNFPEPETIVHELVHDRQRMRDGAAIFTLKYLWWWARYGYDRNPYEVEAYQVSDLARGELRGVGW